MLLGSRFITVILYFISNLLSDLVWEVEEDTSQHCHWNAGRLVEPFGEKWETQFHCNTVVLREKIGLICSCSEGWNIDLCFLLLFGKCILQPMGQHIISSILFLVIAAYVAHLVACAVCSWEIPLIFRDCCISNPISASLLKEMSLLFSLAESAWKCKLDTWG